MDKQIFTSKVLDALDHAQKAMPSEDFIKRMEGMAKSYIKGEDKFSKTILFSIAASFLVLIAVNTLMISNTNSEDSASLHIEEQEYNLIPAKSLYYE